MKKKRGFILYFDILGYKFFLQQASVSKKEQYAEILNEFSSFDKETVVALGVGAQFDKDKLFIRAFSDNFLFVYEFEENNCSGLLIMQCIASWIQYKFFLMGILTRGSISYGEIQYNDSIVFGESLIRAVELEEKNEMPSIIIDPDLNKRSVDMFPVWSNSALDYRDSIKGLEAYVKTIPIDPDKRIIEKAQYVVDKFNEHFAGSQKKKYKLVLGSPCHLESEDLQ